MGFRKKMDKSLQLQFNHEMKKKKFVYNHFK